MKENIMLIENQELYLKRLSLLAKELKLIPKENFDFSSYVGDDYDGDLNISCGTTACALGWATTMPEFKKLNYVLKRPSSTFSGAYPVLKSSCISMYHSESWALVCEATNKIFGLSRAETGYLFTPRYDDESIEDGDYRMPPNASQMEVALHIEEFVRHAGIPYREEQRDYNDC